MCKGIHSCKNLPEVLAGGKNVAEQLMSIMRWPGWALPSVHPGSVVESYSSSFRPSGTKLDTLIQESTLTVISCANL